MKRKQKEEVKAKSISELSEEVRKRTLEVAKLKSDVKIAKVKNTSLIKIKQDELAVVLTIKREKELLESKKI